MENNPPRIDPSMVNSHSCPLCRTPNADWLTACCNCGAALPQPDQAAQAEISHIAYVLWQLPWWRSRNLLSSDAADRLQAEYLHRQTQIAERAFGLQFKQPAAPATAPPQVPPMPGRALGDPDAAARQLPPTNAIPSLELFQSSLPEPAQLPTAVRSVSSAGGVAVFMQEHALKIVFALATVLVLIALRSILGWDKTNGAFLALLPALPIGLTVMFRHFGRRTQQDNPWAAFVYQGLSAVLTGFDLFIIDRFWLSAVGMSVAAKPLLMVAGAVSTVVCGLMWKRYRYRPMWHLLQAGLLISLSFALQCLRWFLWKRADWLPIPSLAFGLTYLGAAAVYFSMAALHRSGQFAENDRTDEEGHAAWILWANLSIATAFVAVALGRVFDIGLRPDDLLLVFLLAGALYGIMAQALENTRLVYVAAFLCFVSGLSWLPQHLPLGAAAYGVPFLSVSTVALALYAYNRRMPARRPLAAAWKQVTLSGSGLGLLMLVGQTLLSIDAVSSSPERVAAIASALLALLSGAQFLYVASQDSEYLLCYPACLSGGIALLSLMEALPAASDQYPLATALYALFLLILSRNRRVPARSPGSPAEESISLRRAARSSGKFALVVSLVSSSALAVGQRHSPWLLVSLLLIGVLSGTIGSIEQNRRWLYAALYSAGYAACLLTLRFAHGSITFADSLLAFVLLCAAAACTAAMLRTKRRDQPGDLLSQTSALWREPLVDAGLIAVCAALSAACIGAVLGSAQPHLALDAGVCLVASLLLAVARHGRAPDSRNANALVLLNIATGLCVALWTGFVFDGQPLTGASLPYFAIALVLQSWGYWLLGRALPHLFAAEVWSDSLAQIAIGTVTLAGIAVGICLFRGFDHSQTSLRLYMGTVGGAFALIHLEILRSKQRPLLALSIGVLLLADLTALMMPDRPHFYPAAMIAVSSLVAACSYLQLAKRHNDAAPAYLASVPLLSGAILAILMAATRRLTEGDLTVANAVWVLGGGAVSIGFLAVARSSGQSRLVISSGVTLICTYLRAVTWAFHLPEAWDGLLLLPLLLPMALLSLKPPKGWDLLQTAYLETAIGASVIALAWTTLTGNGWLRLGHDSSPNIVTITLATYGAAYLVVAAMRKAPKTLAAGAAVLTCSYLNLLLSRTPMLSQSASTLSWPLFALLLVQAAWVWLGLGALLKRRAGTAHFVAPALTPVPFIALLSAVCALYSIRTPGQGVYGILTLVCAGGIWFGLWALDQGETCLHVGTGNLLAAWCLTIYDVFGVEATLLDIYLLPFGLYLLLIGHRVSRRQRNKEAQAFWWMGMLVTLTPALLTRWSNAPGWHVAVLLSECIVYVLWGIAQRIRVFVAAGLGTVLLYAASMSLGILPDAVTTILALLAGVGLFVFGFYALTHRETMKRLAAALQQRWAVWHSWR